MSDLLELPGREETVPTPTYYDRPLLKMPHWDGWNVVTYLFLGGVMGGLGVISVLADPKRESDRKLKRTLAVTALVLAAANPAVLVTHLGRPERFLHMLRIVKIKSPMSMGVWGLVLYSGAAGMNVARAGRSWLNPQPTPIPQVATQHETFGNDTEYKLPAVGNIPDATTDPSQIQVLPVVDPTAKPVKPSESSSPQLASAENGNPPTDQNQSQPGENGPLEAVESPIQGQTASPETAAAGATVRLPSDIAPPIQSQPNSTPVPAATPQPGVPINPTPVPISAPPHPVAAASTSAIPSSLRSQIASMTPEASGAKPVEAAMSSIEPVKLAESAAWDLLAQKVDPEYPDAAKPGKQLGSVVLQVLIGRDGTVEDAKFLQGSLVFARAAIDAVKQWRFKPYSLNGRAVSVQSSITLNFKPPA